MVASGNVVVVGTSSSKGETIRYYAARAGIYDLTAGYCDPQAEQLRAPIRARFKDLFRGHDVLEIACGTGYWTAVIGQSARTVHAVDINPEVICQARERCRSLPGVTFQVADAYTLEGVTGPYSAALGMWWWSHLSRPAIPSFLAAMHARLRPGALVVFNDQLPSGCPPAAIDADGNTLERRHLPDGQCFDVIKNYPTEAELRALLANRADDVQFIPRPEERHWDLIYRRR